MRARPAGVLAAAALALALPLAGGGAPAQGSDGGGTPARLAFRIEDDRVVESSGLAVSRTHPGLAYTVNDSGDDARVFVLSLADGSVVGETRLAGVDAEDMEALAPARGGRLVVGDIGDNDAERDSVRLYVVDEPGRGSHEVTPRTVSITYPGGPHNAEAMVAAGDSVYVVSKGEVFGAVYAAPVLASTRPAYRLHRVAGAPRMITDATLLADGRVLMRDYTRGYVVRRPGWQVQGTVHLPRVPQGETLAAAPSGRRVYVGTEGIASAVYVVRVPPPGQVQGGGGAATAGGGSATATPGQRDHRPAQRGEDGFVGPRVRPSGFVVAVAVALVAGWFIRRRRRPPR